MTSQLNLRPTPSVFMSFSWLITLNLAQSCPIYPESAVHLNLISLRSAQSEIMHLSAALWPVSKNFEEGVIPKANDHLLSKIFPQLWNISIQATSMTSFST